MNQNHVEELALGRSVAPKLLKQPSRAPRFQLLLFVVALMALLPFVPSLAGPFFWDDSDLIVNNPFVQSFSHVGHWFTHSYFDTGQPLSIGHATYFRPLVLASFAIDWFWGNGNPTAFHASNLLLYFLTTATIICTLKRWSGSASAALLVGLLLAWHPTRAESVAWISGRTDILVTLFILLACHARAMRPSKRYLSIALEGLATFGAYTCKETAIVLPIFIALEIWITTQRPPLSLRSLTALLRSSLGQLLVALAYLASRSQWMALKENLNPNFVSLPLATHAGLALQTLGRAIQLQTFPITQRGQHGLTSFDAHGRLQIDTIYVIAGSIALVLIVSLAIGARRRIPLLTWGCLMFLVTWLPTSHVIPTHLACDLFERFLFLPSLGLALIPVALLTHMASMARARVVAAALAIPLLGFGAYRSNSRSLDYSDPHRFWAHELRVNPLSVVAPVGLLSSRTSAIPLDSALKLLDKCYSNATARRLSADAVGCVFDAATYIADYSSDLDRRTQASAIEFFRAVADAQTRRVELTNQRATLTLDLSNVDIQFSLRSRRGEALSVLADLESRQRDQHAIADARKAIITCPRCQFVPRAAKALASFGQIEESLQALGRLTKTSKAARAEMTRQQILQFADWQSRAAALAGPAETHAEAQAFLSIGLFGAAYEILVPHRSEFERITEIATDYARVALSAGNAAEARDVLVPLMPSNKVNELIERWQEQRNLVYPN